MPRTTREPTARRPRRPAPTSTPATLPADVEQSLIAVWPSLSQEERSLWFKVLDIFLPPDAELLELLEQLEDIRHLEARTAEDREPVPREEIAAWVVSKAL